MLVVLCVSYLNWQGKESEKLYLFSLIFQSYLMARGVTRWIAVDNAGKSLKVSFLESQK
jgi:hypothetical protein